MFQKYYESTFVFFSYLYGTLNNDQESQEYILDSEFQNGAQMALLSCLFLATKEDIVEKSGELTYSSKVFNDSLKQNISLIAHKTDAGYKINNYEFSDVSKFVGMLRNKIAHGLYEINFQASTAYVKMDDGELKIKIKRLLDFVLGGLILVIKKRKTPIMSRSIMIYDKVDKKRNAPLKRRSDYVGVINGFKRVIFTLSTTDEYLDEDALNLFESFLNCYKETNGNNFDNKMFREVNKYFDDHHIKLSISEEHLKDDKIKEEVLEEVNDAFSRCSIPYKSQIEIIGSLVESKIDPKKNKLTILMAYLQDLILISSIRNINSVDKNKLDEEIRNKYGKISVSNEEVVSCLISMFYALFVYPFESDKREELDESKFKALDTSAFNCELLNIRYPELEQLTEQCMALDKRAAELQTKKEEFLESLKQVTAQSNKKAQKAIEELIRKMESSDIEQIRDEVKNKRADVQKIFDSNPDYFRNLSIIEGVRNAIAHGNYSTSYIDGESVITFEDIYEGKLTFKASIKLTEFYKFLYSASQVVFKVPNKQKN